VPNEGRDRRERERARAEGKRHEGEGEESRNAEPCMRSVERIEVSTRLRTVSTRSINVWLPTFTGASYATS
jgi:hypothetical protein